jgi:hypothetical protein
MMLLEFDNMCLILWFGEQEVSTLMDLDNPKCKFVSELLETLSTEELSINLINGTKYTSSVLLTNDLNMKDEFLLNKVIVSSAKKQYSSTIKLQEESIKIPNDIKGIDKKSNSDKGCEYRVDKINHCMLNTPKADINICDCSSKDNCKIYKKWG